MSEEPKPPLMIMIPLNGVLASLTEAIDQAEKVTLPAIPTDSRLPKWVQEKLFGYYRMGWIESLVRLRGSIEAEVLEALDDIGDMEGPNYDGTY